MSKLEAATHICLITVAIISAATLLERRLALAGARVDGVLSDIINEAVLIGTVPLIWGRWAAGKP